MVKQNDIQRLIKVIVKKNKKKAKNNYQHF